jgi:hypothetical protein
MHNEHSKLLTTYEYMEIIVRNNRYYWRREKYKQSNYSGIWGSNSDDYKHCCRVRCDIV